MIMGKRLAQAEGCEDLKACPFDVLKAIASNLLLYYGKDGERHNLRTCVAGFSPCGVEALAPRLFLPYPS